MNVIGMESYSKSILCNVIFIARHSYKFYSNLHEEIGVARQGPYKYWIEWLLLIILREGRDKNLHIPKVVSFAEDEVRLRVQRRPDLS